MKNEIKSPTISTLVAELRVVRIGNKQMTKAVFNQLYTSKLHDDDYNIIYPVWGKVYDGFHNSIINFNKLGVVKEWIIFQNGNDLNKFLIPGIKWHPTDITTYVYLSVVRDDNILFKYFLKNVLKKDTPNISDYQTIFNIGDYEVNLSSLYDENRLERYIDNKYGPSKDFQNTVVDFCFTHFRKEWVTMIKNEYHEYHSKITAYNKMVETLQNSPQLFIAV